MVLLHVLGSVVLGHLHIVDPVVLLDLGAFNVQLGSLSSCGSLTHVVVQHGTGHVAIQMSGATQLLFGIKGRRWDTHPQISKLYNPAWVRPAPAEQPANKQAVEGGSYWENLRP